ncbi:fructose-2,6-bisphosphate 2-phosphatase [Malassezia pachydermatis]|uniref:Phosphoglycerate mutase-like protein n=1 Tax=Malassezia pachydermatis TaxID=77020 RepID=A0A0M8MJ79_9BASI|nr:hypothetical protein Malapachy_0409 [Malassezia pachydermatis]KOS12628.1 hypothetical protein Malapachy_0409 [Malassezia pachydermatis]
MDDAPRQPIALLTLIRHAESRANVERVLQGVTDAPLSERGQDQLRKLEAAWRPISETAMNMYELPAPSVLVTSPIGRARKTSAAVARGCGIVEVPEEDDTTYKSPPSEVPPPHVCPDTVLVDSALAERHYGSNECTKHSKRVPGFERPPASELGRAESYDRFAKRVWIAGHKWLAWLETYAKEAQAGSREATPDNEATVTELNSLPHLVLVTHGQWINAFLTQHAPTLRQGSSAYYIRSDNTALFTMEVYPATKATETHVRVIRRNDTRHLGPAPQTRRSKHVAQATTLTSLWQRAEKSYTVDLGNNMS